MRSVNCFLKLKTILSVIAIFIIIPACDNSIEQDQNDIIEETNKSLYGDVIYGSDCNADYKEFLNDVMLYGRAASSSNAFVECVDQASRNGASFNGINIGPYKKCNNDPYYSSNLNTQIQRVLEVTHTINDIKINCSGGGGIASTSGSDIHGYGHDKVEEYSWSDFLKNIEAVLDEPLCSTNGNVQPCRKDPEPWPYARFAAVTWHEVMHTHGYGHGANSDNGLAKNACGYPTSTVAQWHFQRNTMPYIIGNCLNKTITDSGNVCGTVITGCEQNEIQLVDGLNSNTCECVHDPKMTGLGIMSFDNNKLVDDEMVASDDWMGSWHYSDNDKIVGTGDFDGDGKKEFLIKSAWGLGLVGKNSNGRLKLLSSSKNNKWMGSWYLHSSNKINGVGDFNGDGKDEFIITSHWGIGIVKKHYSGFKPIFLKPNDTWLGAWRYNARVNSGKDSIRKIGDFNGDGKDEILITSSWGIGILKLNGSSLTSVMAKPNNTWFGAWKYNASVNSGTDKIKGIGDFDNNGKDEILITSSWGIGILKLNGSSLTSVMAKPNNTWFGSWRYNASVNSGKDKIAGVIDFNKNGKDDVLITSSWGIGVLELANYSSGTKFKSIVAKPSKTWFGSWYFHAASNKIRGMGDFNGDGYDDIIIQSSWGLGLLKKSSSSLKSMDLKSYNNLFGSWLLTDNDYVKTIGDFTGNGKEEILFQRSIY